MNSLKNFQTRQNLTVNIFFFFDKVMQLLQYQSTDTSYCFENECFVSCKHDIYFSH